MSDEALGFLAYHHLKAHQWARSLLQENNFVILDTETTGLDSEAEIIQIGIINGVEGETVINTLIKPVGIISAKATAINGITNAMVADAPSFMAFWPAVCKLFETKRVIIYNAAFDIRMIHQTLNKHSKLNGFHLLSTSADCAMLQYAAYFGDWNGYRQSFTWQPLQGGDHSAVGDCKATLDLIKRMAAME